MLFLTNFIFIVLLDVFIVNICFSFYIVCWVFLIFILFIFFFIKNFFFNESKKIDYFWICFSVIFVQIIIFKVIFLIYFNWVSYIFFEINKLIGFQWYWLFILNKNNIYVFENLLTENDIFLGDIRLLQCNSMYILLNFVCYKIWLTSLDVIHSFSIFTLGVKIDCIPGRCNELIIYNTLKGTFYGNCFELCGLLHGFMPITIQFF